MIKPEDMGYNRYFEKEIFLKTSNQISSSDFNQFVSNFEWDKGRGGVINLGGGANSEGSMIVRDDKGNLKLVVDNEGLKVYGGTVITVNTTTGVRTTVSL